MGSELKHDRVQNHINPPVHDHPAKRLVAVDGIIKAPVFSVNDAFGYVFLNQQFVDSFAAHFGKPFVVTPATNRVGVTDQLNFKFLQDVGNGIEPLVEIHDLVFIDIIASAFKVNALPDFFFLLGS